MRKHSHRCNVLAWKRDQARESIDRTYPGRRPACDCGADHENTVATLTELRGCIDIYAIVSRLPHGYSNALQASLNKTADLLVALDGPEPQAYEEGKTDGN